MTQTYSLSDMSRLAHKLKKGSPNQSTCESCISLRKELAPILGSIISHVKAGDAGAEELSETHRAGMAVHLGLPDTMPDEDRKYFEATARRTSTLRQNTCDNFAGLTPSLRKLMQQDK